MSDLFPKPWLIQNPRHLQKSIKDLRRSSYSESWYSQNSFFKHFQQYLGIFKEIDAYSATLLKAELVEREEAYLALYENRKNYPDFKKKAPD